MDHASDGPVVVAANWYRFRPGEIVSHPRVRSRCFLWALSGSGMITTAGRRFDLRSGSLLRLPWDHDVSYEADARSPFEVGTLHIVPRHLATYPVKPRVAHLPGDALLSTPARSGEEEQPAHLRSGKAGSAARIIELGDIAIRRFDSEPYSEAFFRGIADLVLLEDGVRSEARAVGGASVGALEAMIQFVEANTDRTLSVDDIAAAGRCSPSTAQRLFAQYERRSVHQYVRRQKMDTAASLLRTSSLRIGEVARMVGFQDPLHFSRVFRATFGVAPSRYAVHELRP